MLQQQQQHLDSDEVQVPSQPDRGEASHPGGQHGPAVHQLINHQVGIDFVCRKHIFYYQFYLAF